MLIKKDIETYDDYVDKQDRRGSINDSTLQYNTIIEKIFEVYNITYQDCILDIGTRNGKFIKDLHDKGYNNSYGTDISERASKLWEQWGENLSVYFKIEDAQVSLKAFNKKYKFISMSHVLEHMYDVDSVLSNIKNVLLDENSIVYIVVPQEDNVNHGAHYTSFPNMEALTSLFISHGFEILESGYSYRFQSELQLITKIKK